MKEKENSTNHLNKLNFADDIALISEQTVWAQKLLIRLERKAAIVGLQLNATKTKLMIFKFEKNSSLKNSRG